MRPRPVLPVPDKPARARPHITIRGLRKTFGAVPVYEGFDLDIVTGRMVSVFGPNGCGKSTLINMIAASRPTMPARFCSTARPLPKRASATYSRTIARHCFPGSAHSTTSTIRCASQASPGPNEPAHRKLVASFDLKFDLHRYPYEMSGGQQQTVSIMRALVIEPEVCSWTSRSRPSTTR